MRAHSHAYRVTRQFLDLGWVDFDLEVPHTMPNCPTPKQIQINPTQGRDLLGHPVIILNRPATTFIQGAPSGLRIGLVNFDSVMGLVDCDQAS